MGCWTRFDWFLFILMKQTKFLFQCKTEKKKTTYIFLNTPSLTAISWKNYCSELQTETTFPLQFVLSTALNFNQINFLFLQSFTCCYFPLMTEKSYNWNKQTCNIIAVLKFIQHLLSRKSSPFVSWSVFVLHKKRKGISCIWVDLYCFTTLNIFLNTNACMLKTIVYSIYSQTKDYC